MRCGRAIALLAASLVLTACGGGDSAAPIADPSATDPARATAQALSGKAGKVVWTPETLKVTALRGTVVSGLVTLTAGEAIQDARLFVVPEIADLIGLSLGGQTQIGAGATLEVEYALNIPVATLPGTYEGTVHLRSGSRTIPSTLKVVLHVVAGTSSQLVGEVADPSPDRVARLLPGQLLVKDEVLVAIGEEVADPRARIVQLASETGAEIIGSVPGTRLFQLRYAGANTSTIEGYRDALRGQPGIRAVSLSLLGRGLRDAAEGLFPAVSWESSTAAGPNRHLEYIRAPEAWDITTGLIGENRIKVAVIDESFDYKFRGGHKDLAKNIDFTHSDAAGDLFLEQYGEGHGTKVAGTICAEGGNGFGVVGVAWHCDLQLYRGKALGLKLGLLDPFSIQAYFDCRFTVNLGLEQCSPLLSLPRVVESMKKAVKNSARIVNMSLAFVEPNCGDKGPCSEESPLLLVLATDANEILYEGFSADTTGNVLWVIGAGNEGRNARYQSPASFKAQFRTFEDRILVVAGVYVGDRYLQRQGVPVGSASQETELVLQVNNHGSNFGSFIDVAAPWYVSTTAPRHCVYRLVAYTTREIVCDEEDKLTQFGLSSYVEDFGGTSAAAPQVSGLAVLVMSNPVNQGKSAAAIKACIKDAADRFGSVVKDPIDTNRKHDFHVINAPEAVKCLPAIPVTITTQPASITVDEGAKATFSVVATGSPPLTYQWTKNGTDIAGATSASHTTPNTTAADNNSDFTVRVSNGGTPILSNPARLTVRPAQPQIGIDPLPLDFGGQQLRTPSAEKSFSITNTGSAPLVINSVSRAGANPDDFSITETCTSRSPLAPAAGCSVSVVFTPSALGARSADLIIADNAAGAPHSKGLAGTGLDGPPPPPTPGDVQVLIDGLMWTDAIALDGEWVYFGTGIGAGVDNKWVLNRVSRDGTNPQLALATDPIGYPGPGFPRLYKIAFTGTKVVVGAITSTGYTIWSVDKSTWQVQQIVTGVGPLVTAYGDHAYYGGDGRLSNQFFRISLSNPADVVGVGGSYGYGQLLDPPFLYYGYGSGELSRFNLNTGEHTFIRSFGIYLYQATLSGDSDYIYYPQVACSNHGVIWRVSKSPPFAAEVLLEGDPLTYPVAFGAAPAGQYVYYLENNVPCLSGQDLNLRAVSKVDKTVTPVLLSHIGGQYGLMSDGSAIYWYEGGNPSKIWKFPKSAK